MKESKMGAVPGMNRQRSKTKKSSKNKSKRQRRRQQRQQQSSSVKIMEKIKVKNKNILKGKIKDDDNSSINIIDSNDLSRRMLEILAKRKSKRLKRGDYSGVKLNEIQQKEEFENQNVSINKNVDNENLNNGRMNGKEYIVVVCDNDDNQQQQQQQRQHSRALNKQQNNIGNGIDIQKTIEKRKNKMMMMMDMIKRKESSKSAVASSRIIRSKEIVTKATKPIEPMIMMKDRQKIADKNFQSYSIAPKNSDGSIQRIESN
ncbi:uncharacterized protein LOC142598188 [Dermatophagoides farinae]|uniref:uncharacterized protein LOC142598188 n=1 Tax=Dermatophagoides farinae TaxID=6954 RepID=UPI003F642F8A